MENTSTLKFNIDQLESLIREHKMAEARALLTEQNEVDLADILSQLPEDQLPIAFRILPKEVAAEAFSYFDTDKQSALISAFSDKELNFIIDNLFLDDTVDMIEEMPAGVVKRILKNTDAQTRAEINELLKYPEDSAGSIMTTEYIRLQENMTVRESFERIRKEGTDKETIYTCYVTNAKRELIGIVTVKQLLLHDYETKVSEIMETNILYVHTLDDQENVSKAFDKYNFIALPVVDKEERLVGIITFDDAIDIIQEENTEDIEVMNAILPSDKSYMKTSTFETYKKRIPWLLILMVSATFTGSIISHYEAALGAYVILTAYIPMLMDTGGNAGSQASVSIIRSISLDEVHFNDLFRIQGKEFLVSILCGATLAATNFVKLLVLDRVGLLIAFVVCTTLLCTVIVAKFVGCTLPLLAKKAGFDPAVMSSPFITTIVDAVSLLIYFQIASHTLHI